MEYLLVFAFAGLAAFLCLLLYFDLSPKTALNRIVRRFVEVPDVSQLILSDAPYRRVKPAKNRLPKPTLLNLETSDGSGQAAHPDVVYIPQGFGARKWPYWMACTPYPYGNELFENPEVFASFDGVSWQIPDGTKNPLIAPLPIRGDHRSDPDIVFHQNGLWLFFRETLRSKTTTENRIYVTKSADGKNWAAPIEILLDRTGTGLLSPAVVHDGNGFVMWVIEKLDGQFSITRRTSDTGMSWSTEKKCNVIGSPNGRTPWHIDVICEEGRLSALIVTCTGTLGEGARIHYAYSFDRGETWFIGPFILEQVYEFETALQYRATIRKMRKDPAIYEVWYSAANSKYMWSIAYLQFVREENILLPYFAS
jgi:hypothetical protein